MRLLQEEDKNVVFGGQLAEHADLICGYALDVQQQSRGHEESTSNIFRFSQLLPGTRVYAFTTPEASRVHHHSPKSLFPVNRARYEEADDMNPKPSLINFNGQKRAIVEKFQCIKISEKRDELAGCDYILNNIEMLCARF